jgi:hypothetical protein
MVQSARLNQPREIGGRTVFLIDLCGDEDILCFLNYFIPSSVLLAMKHGKVLTPYACISDD